MLFWICFKQQQQIAPPPPPNSQRVLCFNRDVYFVLHWKVPLTNALGKKLVLLLVVVAFCMLARIFGECLTIHSPPVPFFLFFSVEIS